MTSETHVPRSGASQNDTPLFPGAGGLVWRAEWASRFEGPVTLLWKVAVANAVTARQLSLALFGVGLTAGDASRSHGRTLLSPQWMAPGARSPLAMLILKAGLQSLSWHWTDALASDHHLRYCPQCMAAGFQSALCQIDGLQSCPLHQIPLIDRCMACGAATPRYALTARLMESPFCCSDCGAPLGRDTWTIVTTIDQSICKTPSKYGILARWLVAIRKMHIRWLDLPNWQCAIESEVGDRERRVGVFAVLRQIQKLRLPNEELVLLPHGLLVARHDADSFKDAKGLTVDELAPENDKRRKLYCCIRRKIRRLILRSHRKCFCRIHERLLIDWDSELMYPSGRVCPLVFGYYLWRHHFESNLTISGLDRISSRKLEMRQPALVWPADYVAPLSVWGNYVVWSLFAWINVAEEWSAREGETLQSCTNRLSPERLQLLNDFSAALSPRYGPWSPRITFLEVKSRLARRDEFIVVGPSKRLADLAFKHSSPDVVTKH